MLILTTLTHASILKHSQGLLSKDLANCAKTPFDWAFRRFVRRTTTRTKRRQGLHGPALFLLARLDG